MVTVAGRLRRHAAPAPGQHGLMLVWLAPVRARVVEYFKKAGISKLVQGLQDHADHNHPVRQEEATASHPMKWAYQSQHRHSSDELLRVVQMNVNLHRT